MDVAEQPLLVEVIAYAPTAFYHCTHCEVAFREIGVTNGFHQEQVDSSLPPDLAQDYQRLSDWVRALLQEHCDRVVVRVVDAASFEGVVRSLRYRVRRFPAIVVDRRSRFQSGDFEAAGEEVRRVLDQQPVKGG